MEVLAHFASSGNRTVTRDELVAQVWGTVVSEEVVSKAIHHLRASLGDQPKNPRYIETVAKRGYRLVTRAEFIPDGVELPHPMQDAASPTGTAENMRSGEMPAASAGSTRGFWTLRASAIYAVGVWLILSVAAVSLELCVTQWLMPWMGKPEACDVSSGEERADFSFQNLSTEEYAGVAKWGKGDKEMGTTTFELVLTFDGSDVSGEYFDPGNRDRGTLRLRLEGNSLAGDLVSERVAGRCAWRGTLNEDASKLNATYHCNDGERGELSLERVSMKDNGA